MAKVGLAKGGQHVEALKLAKVGLAKVSHDRETIPDDILNVVPTRGGICTECEECEGAIRHDSRASVGHFGV